MNRQFSAVLLAVIVSIASVGWSQNISATLRGTVRDGAGSVIAGAQIVVENNGTGATHTTTSNSTGNYVVL